MLNTSPEKTTDIALLIESIGRDDKTTSRLLGKYESELLTIQTPEGASLLAKAIQMNDGETASLLLELGADISAPISNTSSTTTYEYAQKLSTLPREPFAWKTIVNHKALLDSCPIEIMNRAQLQTLGESGNITPDNQEDYITLYHGTKSGSSEASLDALIESYAVGVKEVSGTPTLSTKPLGQFFSPGSVGFIYKIPRSLVNIDSEDKPGAKIWLSSEQGVARILTEDKTLPFKDFEAKAVYRPSYVSREVYPTYGSDRGEYSRECETLNLAQTEKLKVLASQVSSYTIVQELSVDKNTVLTTSEKTPALSLNQKISGLRLSAPTPERSIQSAQPQSLASKIGLHRPTIPEVSNPQYKN